VLLGKVTGPIALFGCVNYRFWGCMDVKLHDLGVCGAVRLHEVYWGA